MTEPCERGEENVQYSEKGDAVPTFVRWRSVRGCGIGHEKKGVRCFVVAFNKFVSQAMEAVPAGRGLGLAVCSRPGENWPASVQRRGETKNQGPKGGERNWRRPQKRTSAAAQTGQAPANRFALPRIAQRRGNCPHDTCPNRQIFASKLRIGAHLRPLDWIGLDPPPRALQYRPPPPHSLPDVVQSRT